MCTGVAPLLSFKNFPFAFTAWLTGARSLAFCLFWLLTCPPHFSSIISSFWFKVRDVQPLLSLWTLRGHCGILIGLISVLLCLRERGGWGEEEGWGTAGRWRLECAHLLLKFTVLSGPRSGVPQNNDIKDHRSHITATNTMIMRTFEIARITKCDTNTQSKQMLLEKWHQ